MTAWLAGMLITADRLNNGIDATSTTSGLTLSAGFTLNDWMGRTSGQLCSVDIYLAVTTTINTASGTSSNIADTQCCTIPIGYRPAHAIQVIWGSGVASGDAVINTDGTVVLRTSDYNQPISSGANVRIHGAYVM